MALMRPLKVPHTLNACQKDTHVNNAESPRSSSFLFLRDTPLRTVASAARDGLTGLQELPSLEDQGHESRRHVREVGEVHRAGHSRPHGMSCVHCSPRDSRGVRNKEKKTIKVLVLKIACPKRSNVRWVNSSCMFVCSRQDSRHSILSLSNWEGLYIYKTCILGRKKPLNFCLEGTFVCFCTV